MESDASVCHLCQSSFGLFSFRHTCNNCRHSFCTRCAFRRHTVPGGGKRRKKRVCNNCYIILCLVAKEWGSIRGVPLEALRRLAASAGIPFLSTASKRDMITLLRRHYEPTVEPDAMPATPPLSSPVTKDTRSGSTRHSAEQEGNSRSSALPAPWRKDTITPSSTMEEKREYVASLPIRELKGVLSMQGVDFSSCLEKTELVDCVMLCVAVPEEWKGKPLFLEKDSDRGRRIEDEDFNLCKICYDRDINCVILNCGHLVACLVCTRQLKACPICRKTISRIVEVFRA